MEGEHDGGASPGPSGSTHSSGHICANSASHRAVLQVAVSGYDMQYAGLPAGREPAVVDPGGIVQPAQNAAVINHA
jgi:hypothetical protein